MRDTGFYKFKSFKVYKYIFVTNSQLVKVAGTCMRLLSVIIHHILLNAIMLQIPKPLHASLYKSDDKKITNLQHDLKK
jgi:hypothetical protein